MDATDKVVVVTGGSKGLGRAMALGFAEAGADVVVASRKLEPCEEVAAEIRALGRRALAVRCHVADWDDCAALVDATVAEFGRIDVLVNNAGIAPVPPSLREVTSELFDKTMGVNLKGPLRLTGLAAEHMAPGSSIINISSKASLHPTAFTVVYAAAKAGLNALTRASADELGPRGIDVVACCAGATRTPGFTALLAGRLGAPLPRVPAGIWNQRMGALAAALRLPMDVPRLTALGGVEPRIAAYLAAELGSEMAVDGDDLLLRIRPGMERDARLLDLVRVGDAVRLS